MAEAGVGAARLGAETPTGQQSKTTKVSTAATHTANRLKDAGMFDDSDGDDGGAASPRERAPKEEAKANLDDRLQLKLQTVVCTQ